MEDETRDITDLLNRWRQGSREAENELFALVLPKLRSIAHGLMKGERKGHSLQASELVDQIYFRLVAAKNRDWRNRQHFFAIAGRAMRQYLIDRGRRRHGVERVPLEGMEDFLPAASAKIEVALAVDRLLDRLADSKPEWRTLVEMKYFLGLTDEEAAEAMGVKLRTTQRMWRDVRRWLFEQTDTGNARSARQ